MYKVHIFCKGGGGILGSELFWGRIFRVWSEIAVYLAQNSLKLIQNTLVQPILIQLCQFVCLFKLDLQSLFRRLRIMENAYN